VCILVARINEVGDGLNPTKVQALCKLFMLSPGQKWTEVTNGHKGLHPKYRA